MEARRTWLHLGVWQEETIHLQWLPLERRSRVLSEVDTLHEIENEQDDVGYDYPYELYTDPYNDEIDGECSEQE